jgi:hypothetical protein
VRWRTYIRSRTAENLLIADYTVTRAPHLHLEITVLRITDKAFRYTPSYETDLKKTFKRMEQAVRAAAAEAKREEAHPLKSGVPTIAWRGSTKS